MNQWNVHFSNYYFNPIFDAFYMFQTVLRMNPWGLKHAEDIKNYIKVLIWKVCISVVHAA